MKKKSAKTPRYIFIHASEVSAITGRSLSYSYRLMGEIRRCNGKSKYAPVTIFEFCRHLKLKPRHLAMYI